MLFTSKATICYLLYIRAGPRGVVCGGGGGGGAESRSFEVIGASHEWGKSMRAGVGPPPEKMKIYVSENTFQAILKPIFPYSITSIILSKV